MLETSYIRVNIVGHFGHGKSSLATRLLNHSVDDIDRTTGMNVNECVTNGNDSSDCGRKEDNDDLETGGTFYKGVLIRSPSIFLKELDPVPILDLFLERSYLDYTQVHDIQEQRTRSQKAREIMKSVCAKDAQGYKTFKTLLKESHQEYLAEILDKQESDLKKGIKMAEKEKDERDRQARTQQPVTPAQTVNIVGNFGHGKSSLATRLLNHSVDDIDRTTGMNVNECVTNGNDSSDCGRKEVNDDLETGGTFYKGVLLRSLSTFLKELDPVPILDLFLERGYLDYTQVHDIQEQRLRSQKAREIMKRVFAKDAQGYKTFKTLLKESHQEYLAEFLDKQESDLKKGIKMAEKEKDERDRQARTQQPVTPAQTVNIVGNFGHGKSSLVTRLLNHSVDDIDRTTGMNVNECVTNGNDSSDCGRKEVNDDLETGEVPNVDMARIDRCYDAATFKNKSVETGALGCMMDGNVDVWIDATDSECYETEAKWYSETYYDLSSDSDSEAEVDTKHNEFLDSRSLWLPNPNFRLKETEVAVDIPTPNIHNCPQSISKKYAVCGPEVWETEDKEKSPASEEAVGCRNDSEQYSCEDSLQCRESPEVNTQLREYTCKNVCNRDEILLHYTEEACRESLRIWVYFAGSLKIDILDLVMEFMEDMCNLMDFGLMRTGNGKSSLINSLTAKRHVSTHDIADHNGRKIALKYEPRQTDTPAPKYVQWKKETQYQKECSPRTSAIYPQIYSCILDCFSLCLPRRHVGTSQRRKNFMFVILLSVICSSQAGVNSSSQTHTYTLSTGLRVEAFDGALVHSSKVWDLVAEIRRRHSGLELLDVEIFRELLDSDALLERGYEIGWLPLKIKGEVHSSELDKEGKLLEVQCEEGQFLSKGLTKFDVQINGTMAEAKKCCVCIIDPYRDTKKLEIDHKNSTEERLLNFVFTPLDEGWLFSVDGLEGNISDEENLANIFSFQLGQRYIVTANVFNKTKRIKNSDFIKVYERIVVEIVSFAVVVVAVIIWLVKKYDVSYQNSVEILLATMLVLSVSICIWLRIEATNMNDEDDEDIITTEQTVCERPVPVQMLWSLIGTFVAYRRTDSSRNGHTVRHELKFCFKSFDIGIAIIINRNEEMHRNKSFEKMHYVDINEFYDRMSDTDGHEIRQTNQIKDTNVSNHMDLETGSDEDNTNGSIPVLNDEAKTFITKSNFQELQGIPVVGEVNAGQTDISQDTSAHVCLHCEAGKESIPNEENQEPFICLQEKQKALTSDSTENDNQLPNLSAELDIDLCEESEDPEPVKALDDDIDIHYSMERKDYIPSNDEDIIFQNLVHAINEEDFELELNTVKKTDENDFSEPRQERRISDTSNGWIANEGQGASYLADCSGDTHYIIDIEEQENGHVDKNVVIPTTSEIPSAFGASLPLDDNSTCTSSATPGQRIPLQSTKPKLRMQVVPVSPQQSKLKPGTNTKSWKMNQSNDTFQNLRYKVKAEGSAKRKVDCTLNENEFEQFLRLREVTWLPMNELPAPKIDLELMVGFGEEFQPLMAIIDLIASGTPPTPHISMRYELLRFCTLRSYPKDNKPFLIKLAAAGFYYASDGDGVVCYCCGVRRYNWVSEDDPMKIHKRINPNCKYLRKNDEVNVPVQYFGPFSKELVFIESIPEARERTEQSEDVNNDWAPERTRSPATAPPNRQGETGANSLGINTALPKHTQYATKTAREASYSGWPDNSSHGPQELSDAGFFYAGFGDCVRCFYCGIGLRHWTQDDDPWIEHARWSRNCVFIKQKKGEEFINLVQLAVQYSQDNEAQASVGNGNQLPGQEIERILLSDAAQSVLEMGYQPRIIKKAIEQILRQNGAKHYVTLVQKMGSLLQLKEAFLYKGESKITAQILMEKVLEIEEAEHPPQVAPAPAPAPAPAATKAAAATLQVKTNTQTNESEVLKTEGGAHAATKLQATDKTTKTSLEGKDKDKKESKKESKELAEEATSQDPKAIKAENEQLKEQTLCKVCLDNTVCIVFLPCGHLVTCADCAPAMRKCPICRALVKGTVRTYMS